MFSELCRETLRKAAVCYSRSSASPSPSPPSSPPPSPSRLPLPKEVIVAAVETRDVGCSSRGLLGYYDHHHHHSSNHHNHSNTGHFSKRTSTGPPQEFRDVYRRKRAATPTNVSSRRTSGLESRDGRRVPYAASVDSCYYSYSSSSAPKETCTTTRRLCNSHHHHRRVRSASPEMLRCVLRGDNNGGNRSDSDDNSSGDEAGATPDDNQRSTSAHNNRHSLRDLRRRSVSREFDEDSLDGDHPYEHEGRDSSANSTSGEKMREVDRVKLVRDRQNEERQRKLEELRQQALAAQRYREQREEERRRRIEELRCRDNDRRTQVEERKRQIWEADRERREALIRKNNERLARIEAKRKNERSQIVFAFGSSTPRMLEPADTGGMSSSFWGTRRATSTSNVMTMSAAAPLTRRSSERELDVGSKKRATSAGGLDRKPGEGDESEMSIAGTPAAGCVTRYANRRRTDLMPTIPSPRDRSSGDASNLMTSSMMSGRSSSAKSFTRSPGARSGDVTPSSPSRPPSSMSQQSATSSVASSTVNLRPRTAGTPRRPRPASIAGTGVTGNYTPESAKTKDSKPPLPKSHSTVKTPPVKLSKPERPATTGSRSARASPRVTPKPTPLQSPAVEMPPTHIDIKEPTRQHKLEERKNDEKMSQVAQETPVPQQPSQNETKKDDGVITEPKSAPAQEIQKDLISEAKVEKKPSPKAETEVEDLSNIEEICDMSASMIQKIRITTEEEAKAALAERRRAAREQAEREAELERLRLEEEARLEEERLRAEEEEQRRLEEETLRLAEEARAAEEVRLQQAIEEAKRREEEDRKRKEEEAKQKAEKEEAERKAREEAEKQRLEMVERLKKEEEDRIARRKRVEAIMSRTRAKNQPNTPKGEGNDGEKSKEDSPSDESKPNPGDKSSQDLMSSSLISEATQQFISVEQLAANLNDSDAAPVLNGTHANGHNSDSSSSTTKPLLDNSNQDNGQLQELNGHHNNHGNGLVDTQTIALDNATVKQNNVTNNLLDLSEFDTLNNSNNGSILLMQPTDNITNEDSLNSNLNPTAIPFMPNFSISNTGNVNPFHDAFTNNKQQDNQVTDLLS